MSDIYRDLAARVAGHNLPAGVTDPERARAREAFWDALTAVAQMPGNSALLTALRATEAGSPQFANIEWQSRWNNPDAPHAGISQDGAAAFATGFMGVLKFRLDQPDDVAAIVAQARLFADMVERTAQVYASADVGG